MILRFFKKKISYIAISILSVLFMLSPFALKGQELSISTNFLEYLNFGTINGEFGLSITPKWSVYLQGRVNPFTFKSAKEIDISGYPKQLQNRQLSVALGAKYWPWYTNSGWFISSYAGYYNYNRGGIISSDTYEGDAYGITIGAGYTLMITKKMNLDFGVGIMGGYTSYIKYLCPKCGKVVDEKKKLFVAPNNILVQLSYIF